MFADRALVREGPVVERIGDHPAGGGHAGLVLLGEGDGVRWAARAVADAAEAEREERRTGGRFEPLRSLSATLDPDAAALLFYAAGLLAWHQRARHCGRCGAPTRSRRAGHERVCTAHGCGAAEFPRTDPAIITLVRRDDRALLIHEDRWPTGRFSCIAGFLEPGESLEQAVAREVREEVGLDVEAVRYFGSQPWPFPHTVMIGFRARVGPGHPVPGQEVAEARWWTADALRKDVAEGGISIPPTVSVSRSLIDDWLADCR